MRRTERSFEAFKARDGPGPRRAFRIALAIVAAATHPYPFPMLRFAANFGWLFPERPFLERIGAAARAGFRAVEFPVPYEHPAEAIAKELDTALTAHELVKVRARVGDREERDRMLDELAIQTRSELVQRIGNVGVFFRAKPEKSRIVLPD